jgi:hypothetical protein
MIKKVQMFIIALLTMPLTVSAHQGHGNTMIHAALHLLEENLFFVILVVMAIAAGLALRHANRQPRLRKDRHDSR